MQLPIYVGSLLPDGLFSLSFPDFGLLVPLGNNVLKGSSNNSSLELVGSLCPFLGGFFLLSLLVLATVQDGPVNLAGVALQQMGTVGATVQEFEGLSVRSDEGSAPAGVDFVAAVGTELDLHGGRLSGKKSPGPLFEFPHQHAE
jgi:hypothetical protein